MKDVIKIKILMLLLLCVFVVPSSYALCTCSMANNPIFEGELQSILCSCSSSSEENRAYTMTWRDELANVLGTDTGVTPGVAGTQFGETFLIPAGISAINGTLTGTSLEGTDIASVVSPGVLDLVFTNFSSSSPFPRIGEMGSIKFLVKDDNNYSVTNAICSSFISDFLGEAPITAKQNGARTYGGVTSFEIEFNIDEFEESTTYLANIRCSCVNGTDRTCYNEIGENLGFRAGSVDGIARTGSWLNQTSTLTDKSSYVLSDENILVCANVQNINTEREDLKINYNFRCGDNDSATDRVIIDSAQEIRGISANTTQNQCATLNIYNFPSIQNKTNTCYAATDVCILDDKGNCFITYSTTSANFTLISNSLIENEEYLNIKDENANMLPIIIGLGLLALMLFFIGWSMVRTKEHPYKVEINLSGVIVICFAFLVIWAVIFLLMEFAAAASYYGVLKALFIVYSVVLGFVPLIVGVVGGLVVVILMLGRFFNK